jgi:FkbM family methyltransferase
MWEPEEIAWIKGNVTQGMTCMNIGAHVGYFSKILGITVGESGKIISVEANPYLIPFLQKNLWGLKCDVSIYSAAASNESGIAILHIDNFNTGDNRLSPNQLNKFESESDQIDLQIAVKTFRADEIPVQSLDFVLIDTQGLDHIVIHGLSRAIRKHKPIVLLEFVPSWVRESGENPIKILTELLGFGYQFETLSGKSVSPQNIMEMCDEKNWCLNLVLKPVSN